MQIGIYPGSFDPLTNGHMDILRRSAQLMDEVIIAVLQNTTKSPAFTTDERLVLIEAAVRAENLKNVRFDAFGGLLVDYARSMGARYIIRGLRAVTDFEYELQIGAMNKYLAPDLDTVYFMANTSHSYLSSSMIREICALGGNIDGLVPAVNKSMIIERLRKS